MGEQHSTSGAWRSSYSMALLGRKGKEREGKGRKGGRASLARTGDSREGEGGRVWGFGGFFEGVC